MHRRAAVPDTTARWDRPCLTPCPVRAAAPARRPPSRALRCAAERVGPAAPHLTSLPLSDPDVYGLGDSDELGQRDGNAFAAWRCVGLGLGHAVIVVNDLRD